MNINRQFLYSLFVFTGLLLLFAPPNLAQLPYRQAPNKSLTFTQCKERAKNAFDDGYYNTAAYYYGKILADDSVSVDIVMQLAHSNRLARLYDFAQLWYKEVITEYHDPPPIAHYWLARMYKTTGDYDQALSQFKLFLKKKDDEVPDSYVRLARQEVNNYSTLQQQSRYRFGIRLTHLPPPINGVHSEFGAIQKDSNTMIFTGGKRARATQLSKTYRAKRGKGRKYATWIYKTQYKKGHWRKVKGLRLKLKGKKDQKIGNVTFSPSGRLMLFTVCEKPGSRSECNIYATHKEGRKWRKAQPLPAPINVPGGTSKQPMLFNDPDSSWILLFTSDRPGGQGKLDLWYCYMDSTQPQGNAINLQSPINTPQNEVTPFYNAEDQVLYFSSEAHIGLGELDVYQVRGRFGEGWGSVINLGSPINTAQDDYSFTQYNSEESTHKFGYVSSNRTGSYPQLTSTCCDDIYRYEGDLFRYNYEVSGYVIDVKSLDTLDNATVKLYQTGIKEPLITQSVQSQFKIPFHYQRGEKYYLKVNKKGYYPRLIQLFPPDYEQEIPFQKVNTNFYISPQELVHINYEFNKYELQPRQKPKLLYIAEILESNPHLNLLVSSHTDNIDSEKYNLWLSRKRTETTRDHLISLGIDSSRIIERWYGEHHPIAANLHLDGSDNPTGRELNRRSETLFIHEDEKLLAGAMVDYEQEKNFLKIAHPIKEEMDTIKGTINPRLNAQAYNTMVEKYGQYESPNLLFKVQVGAFTDTTGLSWEMLSNRLRADLSHETAPDGTHRYLITAGPSLKEAHKLRKKVVRQGVEDAFVVPYQQGQRILMTAAIEQLAGQADSPVILKSERD